MNSKRRKVRCDRQFRFLIHEKLITCSKVSIVSLRSSHGDVDTREQCQTKRRRKKKRKKIRYFWLIWNQLKSFYFVLFTFQLILLRWHKVDLVIILFVCNWRVNKILNLLKFTFLTSFFVRFNFNEWQIYTTNLIQLKGSSINDVKKRISLFFTLYYQYHIYIILRHEAESLHLILWRHLWTINLKNGSNSANLVWNIWKLDSVWQRVNDSSRINCYCYHSIVWSINYVT